MAEPPPTPQVMGPEEHPVQMQESTFGDSHARSWGVVARP
jgi:hypothetical protein